MPKNKNTETDENTVPKTPIERELEANTATPFRTGPNVDNGLVSGLVTVDPETAAGIAAANARKANKASTHMTDDGVEIVEPHDSMSYAKGPKVEDESGPAPKDAPAVDEQSAAAKRKNPNTIGNTPDDIKADPKADVQ